MTDEIPQYREKDFLLALLDIYREAHGKEIRHLETFRFSSLNIQEELGGYFPKFKPKNESPLTAAFRPWFDEAKVRGHVDTKSMSGLSYNFTRDGYKRALYYKNPIKYFCKEHWKFLLTISLSFVGAIVAIIRLTQC